MREELDAINNELAQLTEESKGKPTTVMGNSTPMPVEVNKLNDTSIKEWTNIVNELRTSYQSRL